MIDPKHILPEDKIIHRQVAPVRQEYHLKKSMTIKPNQTLFKLNLTTLEVEPVPVVKTIAKINAQGKLEGHKRVNADPNCLYYGAYNSAMAAKHFEKMLNKYLQVNGSSQRVRLIEKIDSSTEAGQPDIVPDPGAG
jgi:hypothetical protein